MEEEYKEQIERIKKILDEHEIKMEIFGCGCCSSPNFSFIYKGEEILSNVSDFGFSNLEDSTDNKESPKWSDVPL